MSLATPSRIAKRSCLTQQAVFDQGKLVLLVIPLTASRTVSYSKLYSVSFVIVVLLHYRLQYSLTQQASDSFPTSSDSTLC